MISYLNSLSDPGDSGNPLIFEHAIKARNLLIHKYIYSGTEIVA